jgi:hypothetical protein
MASVNSPRIKFWHRNFVGKKVLNNPEALSFRYGDGRSIFDDETELLKFYRSGLRMVYGGW